MPGDRVETAEGEIGRVVTTRDDFLQILLDSGAIIQESVFDVLPVAPAWAVGC